MTSFHFCLLLLLLLVHSTHIHQSHTHINPSASWPGCTTRSTSTLHQQCSHGTSPRWDCTPTPATGSPSRAAEARRTASSRPKCPRTHTPRTSEHPPQHHIPQRKIKGTTATIRLHERVHMRIAVRGTEPHPSLRAAHPGTRCSRHLPEPQAATAGSTLRENLLQRGALSNSTREAHRLPEQAPMTRIVGGCFVCHKCTPLPRLWSPVAPPRRQPPRRAHPAASRARHTQGQTEETC
jgi:hypothetical protein